MDVLSSSSLLDNTPFGSSSDIDSDDENPPPSIPPPTPSPSKAPQVPRWVLSIREFVGDPTDQHETHC